MFLTSRLEAWHNRLLKRVVTTPNVYINDYRDRDGREVDLILERRDGSVAAVEVKTAASVSSRDLRGLRHLRERLGERFKAGVLLCTGASTVPSEDRLAAVPLSGRWT